MILSEGGWPKKSEAQKNAVLTLKRWDQQMPWGGNLSLISNNPLQRPNNGNNKLLFIDMDNRYIINLI